MSSQWDNAELDALLELLCEDRLDSEDSHRLEELVVGHPSARRRYIEYIELHGGLYWDTARCSEPDASDECDASTLVVTAPEPVTASIAETSRVVRPETASRSADHERNSARRSWIAPAIALAAVVAVSLPFIMNRDPEPNQTELAGSSDDGEVTPPAGPGVDDDPGLSLDDLVNNAPNRSPRVIDRDDPGTTPRETLPLPDINTDMPLTEFVSTELRDGWTDRSLTPSPRASDTEWIRRAYLDIVGHIPTSDEVERFIADSHPEKRQQLIERLLDHPDYVRNLATVWTNLLVGRRPQEGIDRAALQKYLRDRFRSNQPWNDTVFELVSAEGTSEENGATNFLLAHLNNQAVPATAVTARLFLGREIMCTQCHAHPFNDRKQNEFWELNGFFKQTARVDRRERNPETGKYEQTVRLVNREVGGPTFYETRRELMVAAYPRFNGEKISDSPEVDRRSELARLMTSSSSTEVAEAFVNRMWSHFLGAGFTRDVDDMGPHSERSHPELIARLTQEFIASKYDVKQLIRWICNSDVYQLSSRFGSDNYGDDPAVYGELPAFSRMYLKSMTAEQVYDSMLVASRANKTRNGQRLYSIDVRDSWVQQFVIDHQNDENDEASSFDGTVAQALMMMNGDLVDSVLDTEGSQYLSQLTDTTLSDRDRVEELTLAALSRYPTSDELSQMRDYLKRSRRQGRDEGMERGLEDILWVFLNSNEFILIH